MPILASSMFPNAYGKVGGVAVTTGANPLDSIANGQDVFVVKYNSLGKSVWAARIGSAGGDNGFGTTTDISGNVYVTGLTGSGGVLAAYNADGTFFRSLPNSGNTDVFIVKYNTDGVVQWISRIASTGGDIGYAISTDSSGNVYVTGQGGSATVTVFNANGTAFGRTLPNSGDGDAFIVKYNTDGVVQWVARVASAGADSGNGIATDSSGNVYVTGQGGTATVTAFNADGTAFGTTLVHAGAGDVFIVKYNTNGVVQWVARIASTAGDIGYAISTDSSGNVYVTGSGGSSATIFAFNANGTLFGTTLPNSGGNDAFIVKYNTSGTVQWVAKVASAVTDSGNGIATDSSGNVYVTGSGGSGTVTAFNANGTAFGTTLPNSGSTDAFIVKYNTSGTVQWVARIASAGGDSGNSIAIDGGGNVYVTGQGGSGVTITAFNADGTAFGTTLANSNDNVHVYVVKYNTNGLVQWMTRLASTNTVISRGISVDQTGDIYVTGLFSGGRVSIYGQSLSLFSTIPNSGSNDAFIVKYNTNGAPQWTTRIASTGSDSGYSIATDDSDNIYVTGDYGFGGVPVAIFNSTGSVFANLSNSGNSDVFIVKYNSNGIGQWAARIGSTGTEAGRSIATDSSGNVYVTGSGGSSVTITAFNADGTSFGTTLANSGGTDAFIVKYNTDGDVQWVARVANSGTDIGYGIATDSSGSVYVTGSGGSGATITAFNANGTAFGTTLPNSGGSDAFIVKYNTDGVVQWVAKVASTGDDIGYAISTDTSGNVYVTGAGGVALVRAFNADGNAFGTTLSNGGGGDAFIVKYNTDGVVQWAAKIGSTAKDTGYGIATDTSGNVYVTGAGGSATVTVFNADRTSFRTLINAGGGDAFIVKYNTDGAVQWITRVGSTVNSDTAYSIKTDSIGNIYFVVSNVSSFIAANSDLSQFVSGNVSSGAVILKYDTNGFGIWAQMIRANSTSINGISVDSLGNPSIIGGSGGDQPIQVYNVDGTPYKILNSSSNTDAFIVKYSSNMTPLWAAKIGSSGAGIEIGYSIATDSSGNVYVTGQGGSGVTVTAFNADGTAFGTTLANSGGGDAFIVKYNTSGVVQWVARVASTGDDIGYAITTDSSDNVYVTGQGGSATVTVFNADGTAFGTTLPNSGSGDAFIVKYNTSGTVQWVARVASAGADSGKGIATDSSGNVYVTGSGGSGTVTAFNADGTAFGTTLANSGGGDAFIVKYNTSGTVQWVARVASTGDDIGYAISTDSSGNVYVTGRGSFGATITVFNANGTAFGTTLPNSGDTDAFIVKYNTSGVVQWVARVACTSVDAGFSITTDSGGNVYVTGQFGTTGVITTVFNANGTAFGTTIGNLGNTEAGIVKYNTDGVVQWVARVGGNGVDRGYGIVTDNGGNMYVTGQGGSGATVTAFNADGTAFGSVIISNSGADTFTVKYDSSGVVQWISMLSGFSTDQGRGIAVDSSTNIYTTGSFSTSALVPFDA